MDIAEQLREAMETGEVLEIVYHGGSKPGSKRRISPRSLSEDGTRLRAYCIESEALKTFATAKIQIGGECAPQPTEVILEQALAGVTSFQEALEPFVEWFEICGWYIDPYADAMTLHRYFKNGNPHKAHDVVICYVEENSHRPWHVNSIYPNTAKTFSRLDKAVLAFLALAEKLAPDPRPLAEALTETTAE